MMTTFSPITLEYEDPQIKFDNESRSYTLTPFSKRNDTTLHQGWGTELTK